MASITAKRRLRSGEGGFTADSAGLTSAWLIRVDEQVDEFAILELWVNEGSLPIPKVTFAALGDNFVVCDRISAARAGGNQRYLWVVRVQWKELSDSESKDQTTPTPTIDSTDPVDWAPVVTRRGVIIQEPMQSAFYEGGYGSFPDSRYSAQAAATPPVRSPLTNSALTPFVDNLPPHQRKQALWTIRWLRPEVPSNLFEYELKVNESDVIFSHRGYSEFWEAKTAKIEPVSITQTKWGNQQLWEIVIEILSDFEGHYQTTLDEGMMETYYPGDSLPSGSSALVLTNVRLTVEGKDIRETVLLDGTGKRKGESADEVYAKWRDFELADFNGMPLLGDLISVPS